MGYINDTKWAEIQQDFKDEHIKTLWESIRRHAEAAGGQVLHAWRLHLGFVWGERSMMSQAEVGAKMGLTRESLKEVMGSINGLVQADLNAWRKEQGGG